MPSKPPVPRLLILSQVYVPDPSAVGQHMADVAADMTRRGWKVNVLASNRGYDDPRVRYPSREVIDGACVRRLRGTSFGKSSIAIRLLAAFSFIIQVMVRGLFMGRIDAILVSTSPPLCPLAGVFLSIVKRTPVIYWAMDLNPDQMIALGKTRPGSLFARAFDWMNRRILRQARYVVTLDRFMAQRLCRKLEMGDKIVTLPPWAHEQHLEPVSHAANPFRREHGLEGKLVLMYSGNMSMASPLTSLLQAGLRLQDEPRVKLVFIGGGLGRDEVEAVIREHRPANMLLLPYQPLNQLRYSLSAADVHVVAMGREIVGICHPCKIYGAMAVARPILALGPAQSHISEIVQRHALGWQADHGDVDSLILAIRQALALPPAELQAMGARALQALQRQYSKAKSCGALCDLIQGRPTASPLPHSNTSMESCNEGLASSRRD